LAEKVAAQERSPHWHSGPLAGYARRHRVTESVAVWELRFIVTYAAWTKRNSPKTA